jgi:hypothetical protein
MAITAGKILTAADLLDALQIGTLIGEDKPAAAITSTGTTEKVFCTVTANLVAGADYEVQWQADMSVNTGSGSAVYRLRWKLGAVSDTTGTEFATRDQTVASATNTQANIFGTFTAGTTAQYTIVGTGRPNANNLTQAYGVGAHIPHMMVKRVG